jgi:Amt family ammonium transporter
LRRIVGFLFIVGWNIVWTSLVLCFIKYVLRVPLRMSEEALIAGDSIVHGEAAYVLGPCEAHEHLLAGHYIRRTDTGPGELGMGGVTLGRNPLEHEHLAGAGASNGKGKEGVADADLKVD